MGVNEMKKCYMCAKDIGSSESRTDEYDRPYYLDCISAVDRHGERRFKRLTHKFKKKIIFAGFLP